MNEAKIVPIFTENLNVEKQNKEESFEDYQIIKEDYCSSPRCGIKSKIVTKSVEKIIFSPLEISTKPYFKYCVTPVKDEHFKFDFSQSETNHTRNQEEKNQKKNININNSNNQKNTCLDTNKNELKEENEKESENESEKESKNEQAEENANISDYLHIIDKKESEITLNTIHMGENKNSENENNENSENNNNENENNENDNTVNNIENIKINENIINNNEEKKVKLKGKNKNRHKKVSLLKEIQNNNININNNIHYSIILKEKRKLSFNESSDNYKEKKKNKKSQKNMHNLFILDDNNKIMDAEMNYGKNKPKNSSIFNSIRLTKENIKNIKKKISPFHMNKEKKEPVKVISSRTSTNLNRLKNKKKSKENKDEIKKTKTTNYLKDSLTSHKKSKEIKEKIKTKMFETDNFDEKTYTYNRKKYSNSDLNKAKKRLKIGKMIKNLEENNEKVEIYKNSDNYKKYESDLKDDYTNYEFSRKRRANNLGSFKIKSEDKLKNDMRLIGTPNIVKRKKDSRFDIFIFDDNKNNILLNVKREKEKLNKKISNISFSEDKDNEKSKDNDKSKDIDKSKDNNKSKEKEKENDNSILKRCKTKEKRQKKKSKKKDKNKTKDKDKIKKKFSANNLKLLFNEGKENKQDTSIRKDRSKTISIKFKSTFANKTSNKKLNSKIFTYNKNNHYSNKNLVLHRLDSRDRESPIKDNLQTNANTGTTSKFIRCGRRNSTRIIINKTRQEKITEYTNKQNIQNINEYTRQCLEIIPDLYNLKEIPRCKNKIHPNLKKNKNIKKIALYDLDETIVHCIGEINMNNVENFTRQCDAKIKVLLPGGKEVIVGINIRPHWKEALNIIKDKYHIIAYTASHESYADAVINYLDPEQKIFEFRLYRNNCVLCNVNEMKFYVKDLGILDEFCDLKDVVLIDNSVLSFAYHLDNGIPISPFYDSKIDCELLDISNFLYKYAGEDDIRTKLREVYQLSAYLEIIKNNVSEESFTCSPSISVVQEDEEGERTIKNSMLDKNKINFNRNKSLESINIIEENKNEDDNNNEKENINNINNSNKTIYYNYSKKGKNVSQKNLKFKGMVDLFEKININNNKRSRSLSYKDKNINKFFDFKKLSEFMNRIPSINKNVGIRKKNKFRSLRNIDINFKKEWEEKQKELNNK